MKERKKIQTNFVVTISSLLILYFLACMILNPTKYISKSLDGISAWAFNVLPSVLPFMFFTKLLSVLDVMPKLLHPFGGISQRLFKTPPISIYAFFMAILSGYPVGAKLVCDLYLQNKITREEAFRMTSFCSTSGPMFIVGAVGVGMFRSAKIGYILLLSHIFGAIVNGIIFRNLKIKNEPQENFESSTKKFELSDLVLNSTLSILSVGCIITIFFIVIECLSPVLSLLPQNVAYLFEGVIEITKGCIDLSTLQSNFFAICASSFVIGFGGISTLLQSLTMISKLKMPTSLFAFQKLCHGILSLVFTVVFLLIFKI